MLKYKDLYEGFLNIFDKKEEYTEDLQIICQRWTKVFEDFYSKQIMPISGLQNPNLYPSLQIFKNGLLKSIKTQTWNKDFEILVRNLHLGICQGVTMTGLYTTTPPTIPLNLKFCWNNKFSTKEIANKLAIQIFNWVMFTYSIQNNSGVTIKWM